MRASSSPSFFVRAIVAQVSLGFATAALVAPATAGGEALATCSPQWLPTFGGLPGTNATVRAAAVFDDGGGSALYLGGDFTVANGKVVEHVVAWDGSSWTALSSGVDAPVHALALFDDGSGEALYAAGEFAIAGGAPASRIAKWDGASWSALGSGVDGVVHALAVFDDGSGEALYAGGLFATAGGAPASNLARWDGSSWAALGSGTNAVVLALASFDDGGGAELYAGGDFTVAGGATANRITRWDGASWSTFGTGMDFEVQSLGVADLGSGAALYAGGFFNAVDGVAMMHVAKWDGASWSPLGSGLFGEVRDLVQFDDGTGPALYAAGGVSVPGGTGAYGVTKWNGSTWSVLGSGGLIGGLAFALAAFDDGSGTALFAAGGFLGAGGTDVCRVAKWQASTWTATVGSTTSVLVGSASVQALSVFDDGSGPALHAAGSFRTTGSSTARNIARWNGASWSSLGTGLTFTPAVGNPTVFALGSFDHGAGPTLYAGGSFNTAGGVPAFRIARWNNSTWSGALGMQGPGGGWVYDLIEHDDGGGPALYAGGDFTMAGGVIANCIARWNGASWSSMGCGSGVSGGLFVGVEALAVFDDGGGPGLFAAGQFQTAGCIGASNIARWRAGSWWNLGSGLNGRVRALEVFDDGSGVALYACGDFTTAGGVAANRIAKWNGASWSALGSGLDGYGSAMEVFDDGTGAALYVGGNFTSAGGFAANYLAKWDGASWSALDSAMNSEVLALTAFDDGSGPALFAGGRFTTSAAQDSYIAKWGCALSSSGTPYCTAGTTTNGCVPAISGSGAASASAGSGFTISVAAVEGQKAGLLFYGLTGAHSAPWSGASTSFLCVKAPTQRLGTQNSGGTAGACDGVLANDWNAYIATHPGALGAPFAGGESVWAQAWFRDPPAPKTTNLSDGLVFLVAP